MSLFVGNEARRSTSPLGVCTSAGQYETPGEQQRVARCCSSLPPFPESRWLVNFRVVTWSATMTTRPQPLIMVASCGVLPHRSTASTRHPDHIASPSILMGSMMPLALWLHTHFFLILFCFLWLFYKSIRLEPKTKSKIPSLEFFQEPVGLQFWVTDICKWSRNRSIRSNRMPGSFESN